MAKNADDVQEPFTRRISKAIPPVNGRKGAADATYSDIYGGWLDNN